MFRDSFGHVAQPTMKQAKAVCSPFCAIPAYHSIVMTAKKPAANIHLKAKLRFSLVRTTCVKNSLSMVMSRMENYPAA